MALGYGPGLRPWACVGGDVLKGPYPGKCKKYQKSVAEGCPGKCLGFLRVGRRCQTQGETNLEKVSKKRPGDFLYFFTAPEPAEHFFDTFWRVLKSVQDPPKSIKQVSSGFWSKE